jgi:hypothetical protein
VHCACTCHRAEAPERPERYPRDRGLESLAIGANEAQAARVAPVAGPGSPPGKQRHKRAGQGETSGGPSTSEDRPGPPLVLVVQLSPVLS